MKIIVNVKYLYFIVSFQNFTIIRCLRLEIGTKMDLFFHAGYQFKSPWDHIVIGVLLVLFLSHFGISF